MASGASLRMLQATAAMADRKLRRLDVERSYRQQWTRRSTLSYPRRTKTYGSGWQGEEVNPLFGASLVMLQPEAMSEHKMQEYRQSKADLCMCRKFWKRGSGIPCRLYLVSTHGQAEMEQCIADIGKHLGEATYYLRCHIMCNKKERILELNQHLYIARLWRNALRQ